MAAPRGYCAGVDRAVATVNRALELYGQVYVRKEIVHNRHVVATLTARGAIFVDEVDQVPPGGVVVFSAHGVSPAVRAAAADRHLVTIDATCPLVTKVHQQARRLADAGYTILLIGHAGHEEVEGTYGQAPDHIHLVPPTVSSVKNSTPGTGLPALSSVAWLSQTTLSVDETRTTVERLRQVYPKLVDPPSQDICYATQNRQAAVRAIAPASDLVIVVGSANSSNSVRLTEVARQAGAPQARLVDDASQIDLAWLDNVSTVGLTSGASVPEHLVEEVVDFLRDHGFADVEAVVTTEETLTFALPPQVRPSRR